MLIRGWLVIVSGKLTIVSFEYTYLLIHNISLNNYIPCIAEDEVGVVAEVDITVVAVFKMSLCEAVLVKI